jgi:dTMP kinase
VTTPIPNGLFIVIDGIDGAGKTTQAALLAQWFGEKGVLCSLSKEPTSNKWGQELRESASAGRLTIEEELELFIKDRKEHISLFKPTLDAGGVVILDRYYYSTVAYQGSRGSDTDEIIARHREFAPEPDIAFVLDLPATEGIIRILNRGDEPNEFENPEALDKARKIFCRLAESHTNIRIFDGSKSVRELRGLIQSAVLRTAMNKIAESGITPEQLNKTLEWLYPGFAT